MICMLDAGFAHFFACFDDEENVTRTGFRSEVLAGSHDFSEMWLEYLNPYFAGEKPRLPAHLIAKLKEQGTPYQRRVWQAIREIDIGEIMYYGELAQKLQTGARAIGTCCSRNPLLLFTPCHRVLSQRHLGGYTTGNQLDGFMIKRHLLRLEGHDF